MAERERGAALLTVLLLVAVIAVIAGTALERLRVSARLAGNALATEQLRTAAMAAEVLATTKVTDLLARDRTRVTLAGGWSDRPFALPLAGGTAVARVVDGGDCFNLNSLVKQGGPGVLVDDPASRVRFARLMRLLGTPLPVAEGIAAATADWIDSDQDQQPGGAEDGAYLGRDPAYRTGGTLMADPSEWRAVAGVTPAIYAALKPWLCTLPMAEPARINVNTVTPEQAPLIAMLYPDTLSVAGAQALLLRRPPDGYASVSAFAQGAAAAGITMAPDAPAAVTTDWFRLAVDVAQGTARLHETALIDARHLPARLVSRQWNGDS